MRVRKKNHVRLVDLLKTPDRRAVKAYAVFPDARREIIDLCKIGRRYGKMLPEAGQIAELEIHNLDLVFLYHATHILDVLPGHPPTPTE